MYVFEYLCITRLISIIIQDERSQDMDTNCMKTEDQEIILAYNVFKLDYRGGHRNLNQAHGLSTFRTIDYNMVKGLWIT